MLFIGCKNLNAIHRMPRPISYHMVHIYMCTRYEMKDSVRFSRALNSRQLINDVHFRCSFFRCCWQNWAAIVFKCDGRLNIRGFISHFPHIIRTCTRYRFGPIRHTIFTRMRRRRWNSAEKQPPPLWLDTWRSSSNYLQFAAPYKCICAPKMYRQTLIIIANRT